MAWRRGRRKQRPAVAPTPDVAPAQSELERRQRRIDLNARRAAQAPGEPPAEQLAKRDYGRRKIHDPQEGTARQARVVVTAPVDRYRARKLLDERQWQAADKYRTDYLIGGYERPITGSYEGGGGSGASTPSYTGLMASTIAGFDARIRWRAARDLLPAAGARTFDQVVLHDVDANDASYGGRSGQGRGIMLIVRMLADHLADHYGLPA